MSWSVIELSKSYPEANLMSDLSGESQIGVIKGEQSALSRSPSDVLGKQCRLWGGAGGWWFRGGGGGGALRTQFMALPFLWVAFL